jgi:hypothetical protein
MIRGEAAMWLVLLLLGNLQSGWSRLVASLLSADKIGQRRSGKGGNNDTTAVG